MRNIKIFDKTEDITKRNVDIIVAPVGRGLETSGVHRSLDYVIYNHRYQLRAERSIIPDKSKVAYGDVYIIPEENGQQASLMYAVLEASQEENYQKQLENFYHSIFSKAIEFGAFTVRIPSLSHGVFGYPVSEVIRIGIDSALSCDKLREIQFYCYNEAYFEGFTTQLELKKNAWKK